MQAMKVDNLGAKYKVQRKTKWARSANRVASVWVALEFTAATRRRREIYKCSKLSEG